MSQINPFTGSVLQTPHVQRQQSADKDRQVRRNQEQGKNAGLSDDHVEHQVESSEQLAPIQPDSEQRRRGKRQPPDRKPAAAGPEGSEDPHIDLTA